ncbi:MAG: hypothetical protein ACREJK_07240, partial [Candidatus Methylomirabilales bacterium]
MELSLVDPFWSPIKSRSRAKFKAVAVQTEFKAVLDQPDALARIGISGCYIDADPVACEAWYRLEQQLKPKRCPK